jgi:hypothetical protein
MDSSLSCLFENWNENCANDKVLIDCGHAINNVDRYFYTIIDIVMFNKILVCLSKNNLF